MNCTIHPDIEATAPCARCGMSYCGDCLVTLSEQRLCANCKGEALRDVMSGMHTTRLPLARIGARYVAYLVDHAMLWVVSLGVLRFGMLRSRRLLLTTLDGSQVTKRAAFFRALVRLVTAGVGIGLSLTHNPAVTSTVPVILVLIDCVPGLFTEERVTVHDLLAKTRVVRADA